MDLAEEGDVRWIVVHRPGGVVIAANFSDDRARLVVPGEVIVSTDPAWERFGEEVRLPGRSAVVSLSGPANP